MKAKICGDCGQPFVADNANRKYCEDCSGVGSTQRRYRRKHPDHNIEKNRRRRERYANDPEYRENELAKWREHWRTNDEYRIRHTRASYEARRLRRETDPEYREYWAEYGSNYSRTRYANDPEYRFRCDQYTLARKRGMETPDQDTLDYMRIVRQDVCSYCAASIPAGTADHVDPVNHGGRNHWTNLTGACGSCNSSKNDRTDLLVWMLEQKRRRDLLAA